MVCERVHALYWKHGHVFWSTAVEHLAQPHQVALVFVEMSLGFIRKIGYDCLREGTGCRIEEVDTVNFVQYGAVSAGLPKLESFRDCVQLFIDRTFETFELGFVAYL